MYRLSVAQASNVLYFGFQDLGMLFLCFGTILSNQTASVNQALL
jgi:hypothetical protein